MSAPIRIVLAATIAAASYASPGVAAERDQVTEVVVTATPLRQRALDVAQPVIVVQGDALQRAITMSLGETLEEQPGITGTYFGPVASRPVIRGLGGERVRVLEDGIGSLDVSALSEDHSVTIDPILAQRIEVVKGPGTLLYGNGAIGGVVNVLTGRIAEEPLDRPATGVAELRTDSASSQLSGAASINAQAGNVVFHADGFSRDSDDIDIPGNALSSQLVEALAEEGDTDPVNPRGTVFGTFGRTEGWALGTSYVADEGFFGVAVTQFDARYGAPGPESQPDGASVVLDMKQQRFDASGAIENPFAGVAAMRLRYAYNDYEHQEFEPSGEPGTLFDQTADEWRFTIDHTPFAGWTGTFGVQYLDIDFDAVGEEAFIPRNETRNLGLFWFEQRPLGPVELELGVRYEDQKIDPASDTGLESYDDAAWNGSAGLVWKYAPAYSAALSYMFTQRQPGATELYADGLHVALGRFEIGDPTLQEETSNSVDLTWRRIEGAVQFALTGFYSRIDDYIYAQPTGDFVDEDGELFPIVLYTAQNAEFYGAEGELAVPLRDTADYDVTMRVLGDYVRGEFRGDGGNVPLMPPWRLGLEVEYRRAQWQAGISVYQYGDQDDVAANEFTADGYTMLNAEVTWNSDGAGPGVLIFAKGTNLLDEEARRASSPIKDYAPLPGASFATGIQLSF
jgi:iron complex outermembrane receptor protein